MSNVKQDLKIRLNYIRNKFEHQLLLPYWANPRNILYHVFPLADKTGKISLTNLKQVTRLCGVKLNEQELKEMIQEADKDGDNEVNQEEFVNIMLKTNLFSS